jgi:TIR domain
MTKPANLIDLLRGLLGSGESVPIEGLGVFRQDRDGACQFHSQTRPQVFIAYAVEDLPQIRQLAGSLRAGGCAPWLDKEKLIPGQNWPRAIERAIRTSDAFLACFSPRSAAKRGQFQCELRYALDCARRLPLEQIFVIPVRLEPCEVPAIIAEQTQYVDLFPNWNRGVKRILRAIPKHPTVRLDSTSA